jgi:hypoxanthine phosphoribosyltransferase
MRSADDSSMTTAGVSAQSRPEPDRAARPVHASLEVVFTEGDIAAAVARLASRIREDYAPKPVLMVGILKGAVLFAADLMRALGDYPLNVDFMAVASYGTGREAGGKVRLLKDLDLNPAGRHVLLVEDIVDEGLTLDYLMKNLRSRAPASVRACALLDKPFHRKTDVVVDYVGLTAPDAFLVGYGLDHQESYRNLPYIGKLRTSP